MDTVQKRYINVAEASTYLGLPVSTIYKLTSANDIPHIKKINKLQFDTEKLDKWMAEGEVKTKDEIAGQVAA